MENTHRFQWGALLRLLISSFGILITGIFIIAGFLFGAINLSDGSATLDVYPEFYFAWAAVLMFILLIPSAWNAVMRLINRENRFSLYKSGIRLPSLCLFLLPLLLYIGNLLSSSQGLTWLLLFPPLQLITIIIPLWWLIEFGRYRLYGSSEQSGWDVISFGVVVTMPAAILLELIFLTAIFVVLAIGMMSQPEIMMQFQLFGEKLMSPQISPEMVESLVQPYLTNPLIIGGFLFVLAIVIPMMEEMIKPLALWSFIRRPLTPADGFAIGLMCGASFGLVESIGMLSTPSGVGWLSLVIGRMGTGVVHSVTTALVGWGMVSAWQGKGFSKFIICYLFAALFHGFWNFISLLMGIGLISGDSLLPSLAGFNFEQIIPLVLSALVFILFLILLVVKRQISREAISQAQEHEMEYTTDAG